MDWTKIRREHDTCPASQTGSGVLHTNEGTASTDSFRILVRTFKVGMFCAGNSLKRHRWPQLFPIRLRPSPNDASAWSAGYLLDTGIFQISLASSCFFGEVDDTPLLSRSFSSGLQSMLCEAVQRIPGNRGFSRRWEYCNVVNHFYGPKAYAAAQVGFNATLQAANISAMIVTAQVSC